MAIPSYYPDWATVDTTLPATGKANKVRPKETIRTIGWDKGQIPTAEEFNWQMNNFGQWIHYLVDEVLPTIPNTYLPLVGTKITMAGDATGSVTWNGNKEVTLTIQVVDNSHNHVSANITDATNLAVASTIVKRAGNGTFRAGRGIYTEANDSENADYFLCNNAGSLRGSLNYSQINGWVQMYYAPDGSNVRSSVTCYNGYTAISNPRTTTAQDNNPASLVRYDYLQTQIQAVLDNTYASYVNNIRLGSTYTKIIQHNTAVLADSGGVVIGYYFEGDNPQDDTLYMKPIQKAVAGTWYTVGQL